MKNEFLNKMTRLLGLWLIAEKWSVMRASSKAAVAGVTTFGALEMISLDELSNLDRADTLMVLIVMYMAARLSNKEQDKPRCEEDRTRATDTPGPAADSTLKASDKPRNQDV